MNKSLILALLIGTLSVACYATDNVVNDFAQVFSIKSEKVKGGRIKGQKLKGKYDGMGVIRFNNDDIYFGDINDGKPNGKGIYICAPENTIKNCDNCIVFIGRFKQGNMLKGVCLNEDSEILYDGSFSSERPISDYPCAPDESEYLGYFGKIQSVDGEWEYIGELSQETPNGLGILLFNSNDFLISNFKNGVRHGIGLYVSDTGEWQTEKSKNGITSIISSSEYYASIDAERTRQFKAHLSEALGYFSQALQSGTQIASIASGNSYNSDALIASDENNNSELNLSSRNYQSEYDRWAQRAEKHYNSITNLGTSATKKNGDKVGSAGQGMSGGNYVSMKKSFREAQRQMQSIRRKAQRDGVPIVQSKWETATISY